MIRWSPILVIVLSAACAAADAPGGNDVPAHSSAGQFFGKYCYDCHGTDAESARLRLDRLTGDFAEPKNAAAWIAVIDKLVAGEMPPAGESQPARAEVQRFVTATAAPLHAAQRARQQAEGRVVLRRLNRIEYEQTVHDLLAIDKPLGQLLPEDGSAFGFNNIGSALNTSSQLLERYLEAAEVALQAAIHDSPRPETLHKTYRYVEEPTVIERNARQTTNRMFAVVGDTYVMFSDYIPYGGGNLGQFRAPSAGRYRVRVTAYGYRGPVTMRVYAGKTRETPHHLVGHYDLPADKPTTIEFEDEFPAGSSLSLQPYRLRRIGFTNLGDKLLEYTGLALQTVEVEGPLWPEWPPESHRRLFADLDLKTATIADAEAVLRRFLPRAFRRPVTDAEVRPYVELVRGARLEQKADFQTAIRLGLQAALCSPRFLFLDEKPGPLDDDALASRLSYFLWSSMPDDELTTLARAGTLCRPEVLRSQTERMLADPKADRFVKNFLGQWLDLRLIDDTTPDKQLYPEFDELLQTSMIAETEGFFAELLEHDLSVANFVDSDFAILNERLARHYGIDGVAGQKLRRVALPPGSHRGGVLTQASVLKVTANGTNTSPVVRGTWVLENLLGKPVPPPPPDVPAVEPDIRGAVTIREQLAKHRQSASCAACHREIDPPGFALENFDVIGGWREHYRSVAAGEKVRTKVDGIGVRYLEGREVEAGDELADGRRFANVAELKALLLEDRAQIARCVVGKLLTYATGGGPQFADRKVIDEIVERASKRDFGLRTIVHEIVQSPVFLYK